MMMHRDDVFGGSVAELYETLMVPMLFEPYAMDIVNRLRALGPGRILEIGAGTGVVTRALAAGLPPEATIVATDLNPAMLQRAIAAGTARDVEWRQADVSQLPMPDVSVDAVVCQFAVMFFTDKRRAFSEVRRVLKPGGHFIFSVWDQISTNEFAETVDTAVASLFSDDPPRFMSRTPHGYWDRSVIAGDLAAAGFGGHRHVDTIAARSRAASARSAAVAFCQGTPLRTEIESRDAGRLEEATGAAAGLLAARFGKGPIEGLMQAHIITSDR
jgi:SAM-dependent methyltransferase